MSITVTLVENTPYRLRYLVNASPASPTASPVLKAIIPNSPTNPVSPDLLFDAANYPLRALMQARTIPYFTVGGAALTQAQCRAILNSDDPTRVVLTNNNVMRCVLTVTPRVGNVAWSVNTSPGTTITGSGAPTLIVRSNRGVGVTGSATAYVDIEMRHSYDL